MNKESILMAKAAGLKKNFESLTYGKTGRCLGRSVKPLLARYAPLIAEIKATFPERYSDLPAPTMPESLASTLDDELFGRFQIDPLVSVLDYILEVNSNLRIGEKIQDQERKKRVFISHGRSQEWYKIQAYLEKVLHIDTLELAQAPNLGRSILQKLNEESDKCSVAVIVMTGEDIAADGEVRARENVMHEIGYFQGKYGLGNVVLLHEEGVNIPSNIHGLVYIPFPKDTAEATQGAITRELKVLMG